MIRCNCGEYFGDACSHAMHKKAMAHSDEHTTVCSICGEEFKSYPITGDEVKVAKTRENSIVWVVCHECMAKMNVNPGVGDIIDFEDGSMTEVELINFFQRLVTTGLCWQLQGFYGRTAVDLMENGYCYSPEQLTWE